MFDHAPVKTILRPNTVDRKDTIALVTQDCEAILEENKVLRDINQTGSFGRLRAQVPNGIYYQWLVEEWTKGNLHLRPYSREFREVCVKKLCDPNYKYLLV